MHRLRVFTRTVSICNGKDDKRDKKNSMFMIHVQMSWSILSLVNT